MKKVTDVLCLLVYGHSTTKLAMLVQVNWLLWSYNVEDGLCMQLISLCSNIVMVLHETDYDDPPPSFA
jgi:hypothetical protein